MYSVGCAVQSIQEEWRKCQRPGPLKVVKRRVRMFPEYANPDLPVPGRKLQGRNRSRAPERYSQYSLKIYSTRLQPLSRAEFLLPRNWQTDLQSRREKSRRKG